MSYSASAPRRVGPPCGSITRPALIADVIVGLIVGRDAKRDAPRPGSAVATRPVGTPVRSPAGSPARLFAVSARARHAWAGPGAPLRAPPARPRRWAALTALLSTLCAPLGPTASAAPASRAGSVPSTRPDATEHSAPHSTPAPRSASAPRTAANADADTHADTTARINLAGDPHLDAAIAQADAAWKAGEWSRCRAELQPWAAATATLDSSYTRERASLLLADCTISDRTLELGTREALAATYLNQLVDADASWALPQGIYSPELYAAWEEVRTQRNQRAFTACRATLNACTADLSNAQADLKERTEQRDRLEDAFLNQDVQIEVQERRSRAWALIPFGVGEFYNRRPALGASFLAAEVGAGAAGLGLLLQRVIGDQCTRTNGFASGSLVCQSADRDGIVRRRRAEEAMAWVFMGLVLTDIIVAQILFKPVETVERRRVKRSELLEPEPSATPAGKRPTRPRPSATLRPTGYALPSGGGAGIAGRF